MMIADKGDDAVPAALPKITKAMLALCDDQQKVWARQHPTQGDKRYMNAAARIEELEELNVLTQDQREKLAEAYAVTGQFLRAAQTTGDDVKKTKWAEIWKAVWKDDDKWCKCPDKEQVDDKGKLIMVSQKHPVRTIFSHRDNKEVLLSRCIACGFVNTK